MLFSGQGKVFAASRDAQGAPGAFRFLGNVSALEVALAQTEVDKRESTSGQRLLLKRLITGKDANLTMALDEFTPDNLGLGLYGQQATIAGSTVTDEEFPDNLVVGDFVRLAQQDISALSIEDDLAAALTENTHYRIESAAHGSIEILDLAAFTQPFTADYTYGGAVNVAMFTTPPPIRWLRFEGLNTAESDAPVLVELYNVQLNPIESLGLINDEYGALSITGAALYDAVRADDGAFGPFGRFMLI